MDPEHAWLDSLSEDWVSQPGSAHSHSDPNGSLRSCNSSTASISNYDSMNDHKASSRIPRSLSPLPLGERSENGQNISSQRAIRQPSKLRDEAISNRERKQSRSNSASSTESLNYGTVQRKSQTPSPEKEQNIVDTPEWKRRLLNGDVAYGEKCDLFSPVGLENIFKPPQPDMSKRDIPSSRGTDMVMPSSPPPFPSAKPASRSQSPSQTGQADANSKDKDDESMPPPAEKKGPKAVRYNMTEAASQDFSENDLSASSSFRRPGPYATNSARGSVMSASAISPRTVPTRIPQPAPKQSTLTPDAARMVSGQSDTRHEGLSPIFIARHNTEDGDVDFAALDMSAGAIQKRLRELGGDSSINDIQSSRASANGEASETEDFAHNGRYVSMGRGNSAEGSFQRRMLSPSSLGPVDESAMLQEASVEASTPKNPQVFVSNNNHQPAPQVGLQTPRSSPLKPPAPGNNSRPNSASPLKLFGNHDTFTTEMLSRRLSQFEQSFNGSMLRPRKQSGDANASLSEMNEAHLAPPSPNRNPQRSPLNEVTRNITTFGNGGLDKFQFSEEITPDLSRSMHSDSSDESQQDLPVLDPTSQTNFRFRLEPSPDIAMLRRPTESTRGTMLRPETKTVEPIYTRRRTRSSSSSPHSDTREPEPLSTPRRRNGDMEGKRLLKTPMKDPTPKRRRTLHKSDISNIIAEAEKSEPLRETHQHIQSMIGRKRIESTDHDLQIADPIVMAKRHILRPRTPTPSQRSRGSRPTTTESKTEEMMTGPSQDTLQRQKIAEVQAEIDAPEMESMDLRRKIMTDESRKNSVTTQDFLDEAKAIMAGIRGKTKRRSGLSSVQESESDQNAENDAGDEFDELELEDSYDDSTQERFSRPPSREGRPAVEHLPRSQQDPDLLNHLKQYEEGHSDMEEVIASSLRSMKLAQEATEADEKLHNTIKQAAQRLSMADGMHEHGTEKIRVGEGSDHKRKHSETSTNSGGGYYSQGSGGSSGPPTSRSIQTTSSVGSASRLVIAPHTVSHLIPEELAGMAFDRERNMWVKRKSVSSEVKDPETQDEDDSEEDPFGSIPDLSVDEAEELHRVQGVAARKKEEAREARIQQIHPEDHFYHDLNTITEQDSQSARSKSVSSKASKQMETMPSPKTSHVRQSSWDRDYETDSAHSDSPVHPQSGHDKQELDSHLSSPVDFEISALEDRVQEPRQRRRNVTITFSSPVASVIRDNDHSMHGDYDDYPDLEESRLDFSLDNVDQIFEDESFMDNSQNQRPRSLSFKSSLRGSSRRFSLNGQAFEARPISTIDEQDEEDSFIHGLKKVEKRSRNVSLALSTPVPSHNTSRQLSVGPGSSVQRYDYGSMLELTPMSAFTVHQKDESFALEVSQIAYQRRQATDGKKTLALSVKQLVESITDVEPYEPFWKHLKQLELKDKRLDNLHMLHEFCSSLEELDASNNQIAELDGTPASIRNLRMTHNLLNDLASWGHLTNLQYVDISNNNITTLNGFKRLIHLRGLRADNNQITSLEGITHLDGLQNLRLRNNLVSIVELAGTSLQRLTDLDLKSNCVTSISDIQELRSLTTLNLEDNNLSSLTISEASWALKYLRVSGNSLTSLDVSLFPNLRLLYADRNNLGTITGLLKTKYLDSLSLREQNSPLDMSFLSQAFEVRKMFLSGNYFKNFTPTVDFLNLQYLEMANCGLETLPEDFGVMLGNLRVLNLNMNALSEITSLLGIVRLKKLYLAGNRIVRLRRTATVLSQFSSLTKLDLRNNPLTLGFYPPVYEKRLVVRDADDEEEEEVEGEPFTLPLANETSDKKYTDRLDMGTRMRRRVYELMVLGGRRIRICDGLKVGPLDQADAVWEALVKEGVVCGEPTAPNNKLDHGNKEEEKVKDDSERWQAEDSFA